MHAEIVEHPYSNGIRILLQHQGYPKLTTPTNKSKRSVLLWVGEYRATVLAIRTLLLNDGIDRGTHWGPLRSKGWIELVEPMARQQDPIGSGTKNSAVTENEAAKSTFLPRFIVVFEDEAEARRFVRVWHRREYTFPLQAEVSGVGECPLVHAEFLW